MAYVLNLKSAAWKFYSSPVNYLKENLVLTDKVICQF